VGACREAHGFNCRSSARSKNYVGAAKDRDNTGTKTNTMQDKEGVLVPETVQFAMQASTNFIIMPAMMFLDEETSQKTLKDIETLDVVLVKIPTKALYKL